MGGMISFLNLNRGLNDLSGARRFRLPTTNPFPKLDQRIAGPAGGAKVAAVIPGQTGSLPEMAGDLIDQSAGYAVQNVKCDHAGTRRWSRVGLTLLVGRVLGEHRAVPPGR
jgi:hypothetical protein